MSRRMQSLKPTYVSYGKHVTSPHEQVTAEMKAVDEELSRLFRSILQTDFTNNQLNQFADPDQLKQLADRVTTQLTSLFNIGKKSPSDAIELLQTVMKNVLHIRYCNSHSVFVLLEPTDHLSEPSTGKSYARRGIIPAKTHGRHAKPAFLLPSDAVSFISEVIPPTTATNLEKPCNTSTDSIALAAFIYTKHPDGLKTRDEIREQAGVRQISSVSAKLRGPLDQQGIVLDSEACGNQHRYFYRRIPNHNAA